MHESAAAGHRASGVKYLGRDLPLGPALFHLETNLQASQSAAGQRRVSAAQRGIAHDQRD
jgi:hypothetical protein